MMLAGRGVELTSEEFYNLKAPKSWGDPRRNQYHEGQPVAIDQEEVDALLQHGWQRSSILLVSSSDPRAWIDTFDLPSQLRPAPKRARAASAPVHGDSIRGRGGVVGRGSGGRGLGVAVEGEWLAHLEAVAAGNAQAGDWKGGAPTTGARASAKGIRARRREFWSSVKSGAVALGRPEKTDVGSGGT